MNKKVTKQHIETRGEYNERHDAFYSPKKDIWIDKNCKDPNCEYCKDRPNKPSDIKKINKKNENEI